MYIHSSVNVGQSITELSKVDIGGLEDYEIRNTYMYIH